MTSILAELPDLIWCIYRGHWWCRLAINTEHAGYAQRALELAESALADPWVRGGSRLDLQRRVLRLGKPPRRWRKPPWTAAAQWEPRVVSISAAPVTSGVGLGVGVRNMCATTSLNTM
jgi:fanconi-associated nuclease 1